MKTYSLVFLPAFFIFFASCSTKIVSNNYYQEYKTSLDSIEKNYLRLNNKKAFAIAFTDKNLSIASVEMISDTLTRIYEFNIDDSRLTDTLHRFDYNSAEIISLIKNMQRIKVTWINTFDYYVNDQPNQLIYLSIKPITIRYPFSPPKYISLAYFRTPQLFDEKGRLLDERRTKRIRKLNGQVFYKITDRICYTITERYR